MHKQAESRSTSPPARAADKHANELVCAYDFRDEFGILRFQKVRYRYLDPEAAGRAKTFRYWRPDVGKYGKPHGADALPYRLPELLAAVRSGAPEVLVVEGEKDADNAAAHGLVATSQHQGGATGASPDQARWFAGYGGRVCIVADRDSTGYASAQRWRELLLKHAGLREMQVRVYRARKPHKDLSDHLEAGLLRRHLRLVGTEQLVALAGQYSEERATREGYGRFVRVEDPSEALSTKFEEAGYSPEVARILACQRVGKQQR